MLDEAAIRDKVATRFSRVMKGGGIYLANHSLGRPLDRMADDVRQALDLWYEGMDAAWEGWSAEADLWRSNIARLLGLSRADAVIPKTSAGQGLRAVLNSFPQDRPVRVLTTRGEFDSVDFILKTYASRGRAQVTWVDPENCEGAVPVYSVQPLMTHLEAGEFDLVAVSKVFFQTGQILEDVPKLVDAAHSSGALVLLDVYHAAGVIPLSIEQEGVDFAIGGSYKYLRGGPGACFLGIHPRHLSGSNLRSLDTGWFAKKDTFGYRRSDEPEWAEGGNGWLESTPPVLMPYQAKAGLEFTLEVGVHHLRDYSLRQQYAMRETFRERGVNLFTPPDPQMFGAYSLFVTEEASRLSNELKLLGVSTDARGPFLRFGPDLLNTNEDFEKAAEAISSLLE